MHPENAELKDTVIIQAEGKQVATSVVAKEVWISGELSLSLIHICEYGTAGVQIESESEIKRTPAAWNAGISMCGVFFIPVSYTHL